MIDLRIDDMFATCGGNPHALAMPTAKGVITDAARRSVWILWSPGYVSRTVRYATTPRHCDVDVRSPQDKRTVLIGGNIFPPTMGHSGGLDIINKQQSTSPSVSRITQNLDTSVDGNLDYDGDSTSIFRKVLG